MITIGGFYQKYTTNIASTLFFKELRHMNYLKKYRFIVFFLKILLTLQFHDVLKLEAKVTFPFYPTLRYMGGLRSAAIFTDCYFTP